jgi:hypothetical protein
VAWGVRGKNTYAVTLLAKTLISTGRARRRMLPMVYACYGGCVIGLVLLMEWRKEPKCGGLRIGRFLEVLGLIP